MLQPAALPTADAPTPRVHAPLARPSVRRLALVVEDNPVNQLLAEEMLKRLGFEVALAVDGVEALEACQRHTPDIVLMDIQMPRMDGIAAVAAIRAAEREGARTPIIMLTANTQAEHVAAGRAAGADRHVGKPFTAAVLLDGIEAVLHTIEVAESAKPNRGGLPNTPFPALA